MSKLRKFYEPGSQHTRVIGTYLYPYRLFGEPDWAEPYSATEIIANADVSSNQVLIARNGGLFVQPPANLSDPLANPDIDPAKDFQEKIAFADEATEIFNRIICEFTLRGIVSEPTAPVHIARGMFIDGHALITSASGGREIYTERTMGQSTELLQRTWRTHRMYSSTVAVDVAQQEFTKKLVPVSRNLPALIAGAYSLYSRHQLPEALIDSWIVIEQIIDSIWSDYLSQYPGIRKKRLTDTRSYSAAVRLEVLNVAGIIPLRLYEVLNVARKHRNDLAHRAEINLTMSTEGVTAMKDMIEFFVGTSVAHPSVSRGVDW